MCLWTRACVDKVYSKCLCCCSSNGGSHVLEEAGVLHVHTGHRRGFYPNIRPALPCTGQERRVIHTSHSRSVFASQFSLQPLLHHEANVVTANAVVSPSCWASFDLKNSTKIFIFWSELRLNAVMIGFNSLIHLPWLSARVIAGSS